jgi:hypothetical protein
MDVEPNTTSTPGKDSFTWSACCLWMPGVLLLYLLRGGPYMMAEQRGLAASPAIQTIYDPLFYAYFHTPLHKPLGLYFHLWRGEVFDKNGEVNSK